MKILILFVFLFCGSALGADPPDSASSIAVGKAGQAFINFFYMVSVVCGMGLILSIASTIMDYDKFKQRAENPSKQLIIRALVAAVLMNPSASLQAIGETIGFKVDEKTSFCFAYELKENRFGATAFLTEGKMRDCYKTSMSGFRDDLVAKYDNLNAGELDNLLRGNFLIAVTMFQVIAMYFYLSAWFKIYSISEGKERQSTYGKQMVVLFFSTVFMNLPTAMNEGFKWITTINLN